MYHTLKTLVFRYHTLKTLVFMYHSLKTLVFRYHTLKTLVFMYHTLKNLVFRYHTLKTLVFRYHTLKTNYNICHKIYSSPSLQEGFNVCCFEVFTPGTSAGLVGSYCNVWTAYRSYLSGSSSPRRMLTCEDGTNRPYQNENN